MQNILLTTNTKFCDKIAYAGGPWFPTKKVTEGSPGVVGIFVYSHYVEKVKVWWISWPDYLAYYESVALKQSWQ